ncbi:uncharacterized protein LOC18422390 [Amborella trichopoda]|uniref:Ribosomal protein L7/L12 C-terminal domain-containing protein n=1 Tax=Amborella trichopoda TaxID=13333 RepID=W1NEZ3_AMBTC|nr:uncharacterized protein LOC18422390 [Amborella trichopoda]XP_020521265.1 uncharacterized protein LOC18422390 [Amborella trichopoda]XP_020521268.1 uncharacterized protein LOC18422390 [Amborella trichopoda]XP_020521275.1 uncharacterized protein LOC18422390 [Amborella trichopoda]XP_020521279.1 uncharacterized protein LOC18422390 [Amborella trichopoda]XP_020521284.1 uncharacterized protein LOC18422390 [Amborella trichopoda]ERM94362.1 hypothetical protein AMTR_s00010p00247540 [Amborella trichop|eukprot:XP_006827125.1 uncharacterized protein LOC18422390 [Amborella trichopoda]
MILISRFRSQFSNRFCRNAGKFTPMSSKWVRPYQVMHYSSAPLKDEEDEEEVTVDQRQLPADYDPENFDPTEHRGPPTDRVFRLVDEISGLTLLEVSKLSEIMMKKLGMKEMPVIGMMKAGMGLPAMPGKGSGSAAKEEEKKPEKTVFELRLQSYEAASKIKVIKEVRSFTDLGLKEAKDLVEKIPSVIKRGVSKEEGEQIIEKLKAVGAKVVME